MKFRVSFIVSLLILTQTIYAGSIYKCEKDNGRLIFRDKPCGKMKGKLIHQETKAAATKKKTRYFYPYTNSSYKKYDTDYSRKKNQASHYKNKTKVGNVHLQIKNEAKDTKINLQGSF